MPNPRELKTEVLVIGAGPGGYVAAIRAGQLKKKTVIVERDKVGGLCLNYGCIPSKALLYASELIKNLEKAKKYGISAEKVKIDIQTLRGKKQKVVNQLVSGVEFLLKGNGAQTILGEARFVEPKIVEVNSPSGERTRIVAENVIIATGSLPFSFPFLPLDGKKVITSKEALEVPFIPKEMGVVGGGYVGMELASVYHALGSRVTVIEMLDLVCANADKQIAQLANQRFKKDGVNLLTSTKVTGSRQTSDGKVELTVTGPQGEKKLKFDLVMVAVGHKAITSSLGLDKIGMRLNQQSFIETDSRMRTNIPGVFAVGDCTGRQLLAHKAFKEGEVAAEVIAGNTQIEMDYRVIPWAVFTHPEIAGVGLTEEEALQKGHQVKIGTFPFRAIGRAIGMDETDGLIKVVADQKHGEILGVHMFGASAGELIAEAAVAMGFEATADEWGQIIHVHPTLSESVMEAALAVDKRSVHMVNKQ
jgi:dihydrolipoamide dehydrogenase